MTNILALLGDVSHVDIVNVTDWGGGGASKIFSLVGLHMGTWTPSVISWVSCTVVWKLGSDHSEKI